MIRFKLFLEAIARANGLGDRVEWLFYPGMLLDSRDKWWDDFGTRHAFHEGIDICFYRTGHKQDRFSDSGSYPAWVRGLKVPAMDDGVILNICEDFLGRTLVVEHNGFYHPDYRIVFTYSHLTPDPGLEPGSRIKKGDILATVFDTRLKKSKLLSHLHFSCIEVSRDIEKNKLNWNLFPHREKVNLINPLFI